MYLGLRKCIKGFNKNGQRRYICEGLQIRCKVVKTPGDGALLLSSPKLESLKKNSDDEKRGMQEIRNKIQGSCRFPYRKHRKLQSAAARFYYLQRSTINKLLNVQKCYALCKIHVSVLAKSLCVHLTSKFRSQDIEEFEKSDWAPQMNTESRNSLFEVTGYPLTGDIPLLNRKIFKGTRVNIREHPYIVSIRRRVSHYLTGTLITKNLILTVAHPIYEIPVHELRVVVGENYSDRGTTLLTVTLVVIHQDFDPYTLVGDLAMIRFYEDVLFKSNVKSISLVAPHVNISGSTACVTGWGRCDLTGKELCLPRGSDYYPDEKMDPMLRTISLTITSPNYYCEGYNRHDTRVRRGMLCVGTARENHRTFSCLAVPGAPLVIKGKLAGILSWGFGCAYQNDLPLVYTDIKYYINWISKNVAIFRQLSKTDFTQLFEATKSYVILEWLRKSRITKPKVHTHRNRELTLINLDKSLTRLDGQLYDIRDFIHNNKFQETKKLLYEELLYLEKQNEMNKTSNLKLLSYTVKANPFFSNISLLQMSINEEDYNSSSSDSEE